MITQKKPKKNLIVYIISKKMRLILKFCEVHIQNLENDSNVVHERLITKIGMTKNVYTWYSSIPYIYFS